MTRSVSSMCAAITSMSRMKELWERNDIKYIKI